MPLTPFASFLPFDAGCAPLFLNREKNGIFAYQTAYVAEAIEFVVRRSCVG